MTCILVNAFPWHVKLPGAGNQARNKRGCPPPVDEHPLVESQAWLGDTYWIGVAPVGPPVWVTATVAVDW